MDTILVKLGGSVITRKRELSTLRPKVLTRLAEELAAGRKRAGDVSLVVIHGAGSFGHPWAKKWALNRSPTEGPTQRPRGAVVTSYQVRSLHLRVLKALVEAGLPAISIPPFPLARNDQGRLVAFATDPVRVSLERGFVPVAFGDVVLDDSWDFSILSGDTLMLELAQKLSAKRAIFVSDVDGFLAHGTPGKVIAKVTEETLDQLGPVGKIPDVTGGIAAKAARVLDLGRLGVRTGLINGMSPGRLQLAIAGEETFGSWA